METLKYKITHNKASRELLEFIEKTKEGKYTKDKPIVSDIAFKRIEIQEQNESINLDNLEEENLLFGITS